VDSKHQTYFGWTPSGLRSPTPPTRARPPQSNVRPRQRAPVVGGYHGGAGAVRHSVDAGEQETERRWHRHLQRLLGDGARARGGRCRRAAAVHPHMADRRREPARRLPPQASAACGTALAPSAHKRLPHAATAHPAAPPVNESTARLRHAHARAAAWASAGDGAAADAGAAVRRIWPSSSRTSRSDTCGANRGGASLAIRCEPLRDPGRCRLAERTWVSSMAAWPHTATRTRHASASGKACPASPISRCRAHAKTASARAAAHGCKIYGIRSGRRQRLV